MALEALAAIDHSDYGFCGLCLSEFSSHGDQVCPHYFMGRISEIARQCRIVGEKEETTGRLIESPDGMHVSQVRRQHIEDRLTTLFVTVRRDDPFGFMKEEKSFDRVLNRLVIDRDRIFRP